jgi:hypothetical protein
MNSDNQKAIKFTPSLKKTHATEGVTIATNCTACHDGKTTAAPKNEKHVATNLDCATCHLLTAWKPASFKHQATDTNCISCHNGSKASNRPTTHTLSPNAQCSICHSQNKWAPAMYNTQFAHSDSGPLPSLLYRGKISLHKDITNCTSCHATKTDSVVYQYQKGGPSCVGCHLKDLRNEFHHGQPVPRSKTCAECHGYKDWDVRRP